MKESTRQKISKSQKGDANNAKSVEVRNKISQSLKGNTPWNKGKCKEEDERRAKNGQSISNSKKGSKLSQSHKYNISKGNSGKIRSSEAKKKISNTLKGHKVSEETRKKISESLKRRKKEQLNEFN